MPDITFLMCPYSDPDPAVRQYRYEMATKAAAGLTRRGETVFSPVTHSHALCLADDRLDPLDARWYTLAHDFLALSKRAVLLALDGWETSVGVQNELREVKKRGMSLEFIVPEELT